MASLPAARRFDVHEYHRMLEAGILTEDDRVELIEGAIVQMPPMASQHASCISRLIRLFHVRAGDSAILSVQCPIRLHEYAEPEPDVALLRPRTDFYKESLPGPADVLLVVEIAPASESFDRRRKAPLYARAGIPEMWLVDLPRECVVVRTSPSSGRYRVIQTFRRGERLRVAALPQVELAVDEILG